MVRPQRFDTRMGPETFPELSGRTVCVPREHLRNGLVFGHCLCPGHVPAWNTFSAFQPPDSLLVNAHLESQSPLHP